jgi:hypothetical protein
LGIVALAGVALSFFVLLTPNWSMSVVISGAAFVAGIIACVLPRSAVGRTARWPSWDSSSRCSR